TTQDRSKGFALNFKSLGVNFLRIITLNSCKQVIVRAVNLGFKLPGLFGLSLYDHFSWSRMNATTESQNGEVITASEKIVMPIWSLLLMRWIYYESDTGSSTLSKFFSPDLLLALEDGGRNILSVGTSHQNPSLSRLIIA